MSLYLPRFNRFISTYKGSISFLPKAVVIHLNSLFNLIISTYFTYLTGSIIKLVAVAALNIHKL